MGNMNIVLHICWSNFLSAVSHGFQKSQFGKFATITFWFFQTGENNLWVPMQEY